jgi:hypothetical protein
MPGSQRRTTIETHGRRAAAATGEVTHFDLHTHNRKPEGPGNQVEDEREHDPTLGKGVADLPREQNARNWLGNNSGRREEHVGDHDDARDRSDGRGIAGAVRE